MKTNFDERELYEIGLDIDNKYDLIKDKCVDKWWNIIYRGIFDRFGSIDVRNKINSELNCYITIVSDNIIYKEIINNLNYEIIYNSCNQKEICIKIHNKNAFNFLNYIYDNSDARYRNNKLYSIYEDWIMFGNNICSIPILNIFFTDKDSIKPYKNKASDMGYDLTIVKEVKRLNSNTIIYDTCIKIQHDFGFYIKLIPNMSLIESGYILNNKIEDNLNENETLKVILTKTDDKHKDLKLPFCCCKMILERILYYNINFI